MQIGAPTIKAQVAEILHKLDAHSRTGGPAGAAPRAGAAFRRLRHLKRPDGQILAAPADQSPQPRRLHRLRQHADSPAVRVVFRVVRCGPSSILVAILVVRPARWNRSGILPGSVCRGRRLLPGHDPVASPPPGGLRRTPADGRSKHASPSGPAASIGHRRSPMDRFPVRSRGRAVSLAVRGDRSPVRSKGPEMPSGQGGSLPCGIRHKTPEPDIGSAPPIYPTGSGLHRRATERFHPAG